MRAIDINCDLGESFGAYTIGNDQDILDYISSVNIACGFHAGDPVVMARTVEMAAKKNLAIGAHPGFPDLRGFGRRAMQLSPEEVRNDMLYQIGALDAFVRVAGARLHHVKPHGALYNMAAVDYDLAFVLAKAVYDYDPNLIFVALAGSAAVAAAKDAGLQTAGEVFADRAYQDDGTLLPRNQPGAVIHDEQVALQRVLQFVEKRSVVTISGKEIQVDLQTVCLHGDNEQAVAFAKKIKQKLQEKKIQTAPLVSEV